MTTVRRIAIAALGAAHACRCGPVPTQAGLARQRLWRRPSLLRRLGRLAPPHSTPLWPWIASGVLGLGVLGALAAPAYYVRLAIMLRLRSTIRLRSITRRRRPDAGQLLKAAGRGTFRACWNPYAGQAWPGGPTAAYAPAPSPPSLRRTCPRRHLRASQAG
jgi:hypothetical protein